MSDMSAVYLIMVGESNVDSSSNHNKYYTMSNNGDGTFTAKWGRVGGNESSKVYPMSKWNSTISSKKKKGYVERTNLMEEVIENSSEDSTPVDEKFSLIQNLSVRNIIKRLWEYANTTIQKSYRVSSSVVTQAMIDAAQEEIDALSTYYHTMSVDDFNKVLKKIFVIIPRKMKDVNAYLAQNKKDFMDIIFREQSLLDTMAGQVYKPAVKALATNDTLSDDEANKKTMLDEMGISMEEASEEDVEKIKKAMGDSANKFYKAWRVVNHETEPRYQKYRKGHGTDNVRLLCHGSRNQNWFNIIKMGLLMRPAGVVVQGSMFGSRALYFGNPDKFHGGVAKSIGYTSLNGYWTRDHQNCGFLAFFEVDLGTPFNIYQYDYKYQYLDYDMLQKMKPGAGHTFAHGGSGMLRNDEIIIYKLEQATIRYLVEIR